MIPHKQATPGSPNYEFVPAPLVGNVCMTATSARRTP
jgi:hypothetical protein